MQSNLRLHCKQIFQLIFNAYCNQPQGDCIGESQNLLERFGNHFGHLNRSTHDCCQLQTDWDKYGKQCENKWFGDSASLQCFTVEILCLGPEWQHKEKRVSRQNKLIANLPLHERYNPSPSNNGIYRQTLEIENQMYSSIASAAETLNLSKTTIRRRLGSGKYPSYARKTVQVGRLISINGISYSSIQSVVEQGLAKDRFQVSRRLQSANAKWQFWFYIEEEKQV